MNSIHKYLITCLCLLSSCDLEGDNGSAESSTPKAIVQITGDEELTISINPLGLASDISSTKKMLYRLQGRLHYSGTEYRIWIRYSPEGNKNNYNIYIIVFINSTNIDEGKYRIDGYEPDGYGLTTGHNFSSIEYAVPNDDISTNSLKRYYANDGEIEVRKKQDGSEVIILNIDYGLLTDDSFIENVLNLEANIDLIGIDGGSND